MSLLIKRFQCSNCGFIIDVSYGVPKPQICPRCGAPHAMIHRINKGSPSEKYRRGRGFQQ